MPVRKRNLKKRGLLNTDEEAWLRGEFHCGFIEFLPDDQLQEVWDRYGDHTNYFWEPGMDRPVARSSN
jgi:hypothetical protein